MNGNSIAELHKVMYDGAIMQFRIEIYTRYTPPALISQFIGRFCRGTSILFRACWKNGAAFIRQGRGYLVYLDEPMDDYTGRTKIMVAGSNKEAVQEREFSVLTAFRALLHHWYSGLQFSSQRNTVLLEERNTSTHIMDGLLNNVDTLMANGSFNYGPTLDLGRCNVLGRSGREIVYVMESDS